MKKSIMSLIESVKVNQKILSFDKASTRQAIVMKLLSLLDWDIFDVEEVRPDYKSDNQHVDFVLRSKGNHQVFIEVLKAGDALHDHPEQLLDQAAKEDAGISVFTNGLNWWFYLSTDRGNWDLRKYCVVDLVKQPSEKIAPIFIDLLSKENITSGRSVKAGDAFFKKQQQKIIEEVLPEAFKTVITGPHDDLVTLVKGVAEKLSGQKADKKVVLNFLKEQSERWSAAISAPPAAAVAKPKAAPAPAPKEEVTKNVSSFTFKGTTYPAKSWPDLVIKLCETLKSKFNMDIEKMLWQQTGGRNYFFQNPSELNRPSKIPGNNIYIESQLTQAEYLKVIHSVLTTFGFSNKDITIDTN